MDLISCVEGLVEDIGIFIEEETAFDVICGLVGAEKCIGECAKTAYDSCLAGRKFSPLARNLLALFISLPIGLAYVSLPMYPVLAADPSGTTTKDPRFAYVSRPSSRSWRHNH